MVIEKRGVLSAFAVLTLFSIATSTSASAVLTRIGLGFISLTGFTLPITAWLIALTFIVVIVYIADIALWLLRSALTYLFVRIFQGVPSFNYVLLVHGYAKVGRSASVICMVASTIIGGLSWLVLGVIGFIASIIVELIIETIGISETQKLTTGRALASVLLSLIIELLITLAPIIVLMTISGISSSWV